MLLSRICHQAFLCAGQSGIDAWAGLCLPHLLLEFVMDIDQQSPGGEAETGWWLSMVVARKVEDCVHSMVQPGFFALCRFHLFPYFLGNLGGCRVGDEGRDEHIGLAQDRRRGKPLIQLLGSIVS